MLHVDDFRIDYRSDGSIRQFFSDVICAPLATIFAAGPPQIGRPCAGNTAKSCCWQGYCGGRTRSLCLHTWGPAG